MKIYRYQVTFKGKVSPQDEMGTEMGIEAAGLVGLGCDPLFGEPGSSAQMGALVTNDEDGAFSLQGEIVFPTGTLSFESGAAPPLRDLADPSLQGGEVKASITSGTGDLTGAQGTLFFHFTVDDEARFVDQQSGLVFIG